MLAALYAAAPARLRTRVTLSRCLHRRAGISLLPWRVLRLARETNNTRACYIYYVTILLYILSVNFVALAIGRRMVQVKDMTGLIEDLHGIGKLTREGVAIGEVEYSIRVYQAGEQRWAYPYAEFRPRQNLDFYSLVGQRITLHLEDGRLWDCFIQSLDGKVTAAGGWPVKQESS